MCQIEVSSTLTVYHDGQFWVGLFERVEGGGLSACRVVFGAEPSDEQIQQLICASWGSLRFTRPIEQERTPHVASNPKRRQREAAREMQRRGPSTKAQQALSGEREAVARERKAEARKQRERERQERFEQRQERRKQRHRGR